MTMTTTTQTGGGGGGGKTPIVTIEGDDDEPEQIPPCSMEAEAAVLSASILDPTAILKVIDFLKPDHFFSEAHRRIFEACVDLHTRGEEIDVLAVIDWLRDRQRLAQVGGPGYLTEIMDASP